MFEAGEKTWVNALLVLGIIAVPAALLTAALLTL